MLDAIFNDIQIELKPVSDQYYSNSASFQIEKIRQLEDDICKILINGRVDLNKIERCYSESLPPRPTVKPQKIKSKKDVPSAINHLMDYSVDADRCYMLDFLQILQASESGLRYKLSRMVDQVSQLYKIEQLTIGKKYQENEEKAKNLYKHPSILVLKLQKSAGNPKSYQISLKSYKKDTQSLSVIECDEIVRSASELVSWLSKSWLSKIEPHIDDGHQSFIIAVPQEILSWDIDLLRIEQDSDHFTTLNTIGPVSYCNLDRYGLPNNQKINWSERWEKITTNHSRVVPFSDHTLHKEAGDITRSLQECASGQRWASCLVEMRSNKYISTDICCLYDSGVPSMTWVRNTIANQNDSVSRSNFDDLMPHGDFHQDKLLNYAFKIAERCPR